MSSWMTKAAMIATPQASDSRISFLVLMVPPAYHPGAAGSKADR